MEKIIYSKFSNQRAEKYAIRTEIIQKEAEMFVRKVPISMKSEEHIASIQNKYDILNSCFKGSKFEANFGKYIKNYFECEFINGMSYDQLLDERLSHDDYAGFFDMVKEYAFEIRKVYSGEKFEISDEFRQVFGNIKISDDLEAARNIDIDLVFANILLENKKWIVIDYEWTFDFLIPINYLIWRTISEYMNYVDGVRNKISSKQLYELVGISEIEVEIYQKMESHFQYDYCYKDTKNLYEMQEMMQGGRIREEIFETAKIQEASSIVQVYFDKGQGYSEKNSIYMSGKADDDMSHCLSIEIDKDVKNVRIDPSQISCMIKIKSINAMIDSGEMYKLRIQSNGLNIGPDVIIFPTDDPQIYITNFMPEIKRIQMVYQIWGLPAAEEGGEINNFVRAICNTIDEQRETIERNEEQVKENIKQIQKKDEIIREKEREIEQKNVRILDQENQIQNWNIRWEAIISSTSWRLTKPLRLVGAKMKRNKYTYLLGKGIKFFFKNGFRATYKKVKFKINRRHRNKQISIPFPEKVGEKEKIILQVPLLEECKKKIAVHIHLFYEDLLEELLQYVRRIPYEFDLYITCQQTANIKKISNAARKVKNSKNVSVIPCTNRGRDIAPLYVILGEKIREYEYFLHIHSKKSLYCGKERVEWRQYSLASVLGTEELVMKIFSLFENEQDVGIICPDHYDDVPMLAYSWLANEAGGRLLSSRLGIPFQTGIIMYPLGSFFWARTDAIMPLLDANLKLEDFDEEHGQTDGTLAHIIERILGAVVAYKGYRQIFVDYREGVFRYDSSMKAFRNYLTGMSVDTVVSSLNQYDVVSFDIFDTLVTRNVLRPDDVFRILERKLAEEYELKIDFVNIRKTAESNAWNKRHAYTNIHDIYREISEIIDLSEDICQMIKNLEIELENMLIIPRYDMLLVYNELKKRGKRIILVSDMYLTSEIVEEMLRKCGYTGFEKIFISCEIGLRKDQGNIWSEIGNYIKDCTFIHVGDNPRADWQTLSDQRKNALWVINPRDAWKISKYFEKTNSLNDGSLFYSLIVGMLVNQGLFNSPFSMNQWGRVIFDMPKQVGYSVFGPIFYEFIVWVHNNTEDNTILAFLAREGYLLEQIYDIVYGDCAEKREHCYFLASRRATGVAGVESWEDVRELISKDFKGNLKNLLDVRLGIKIDFSENEEEILISKECQEDVDRIMTILESQKEEIMQQFGKEKQNYLSYVRSMIPEERWKDLVVVDVGYSGTIQYFLAKMLATKIGGCYLEMFGENKPDKIGCVSKKMYGLENEFGMTICINELFLEAVLEAPYGQLVCFEMVDGDIQPVFKAKEDVSKEIIDLQEGILDYCRIRKKIQKNAIPEWSTKLMEYFCGGILNGDFLSDQLAEIFKVEDDYCCSATLEYSRERQGWS